MSHKLRQDNNEIVMGETVDRHTGTRASIHQSTHKTRSQTYRNDLIVDETSGGNHTRVGEQRAALRKVQRLATDICDLRTMRGLHPKKS
jgi:hypothetical protein